MFIDLFIKLFRGDIFSLILFIFGLFIFSFLWLLKITFRDYNPKNVSIFVNELNSNKLLFCAHLLFCIFFLSPLLFYFLSVQIYDSEHLYLTDNILSRFKYRIQRDAEILLQPWDLRDLFALWFDWLIYLYTLIIFSCPVLLWFRKRTFFRAWFVSVTAAITPSCFITCLMGGSERLFRAIWLMTGAYLIAWLAALSWREFRANIPELFKKITGKTLCRFIGFLIGSALVGNSILLAIGLRFFNEFRACLNLEFVDAILRGFYDQATLLIPPWNDREFNYVLFYLAPIVYCSAALCYPLLLWWRKKTVFRAWLLALGGVLTPPWLTLYLEDGSSYIMNSLPIMTLGYVSAWLLACGWRYYHKRKVSRG